MAYESESQPLGDPNDVPASANTLKAGDWMAGALSSASDVDYYKFTAQAGLVTLDFAGASTFTTERWRVDLLNASGDLLRTLDAATAGTPAATAVAGKPAQVSLSGLASAVAVGDQFTLQTAAADREVFTIVSVDAQASGSATVTLDKAYTGAAGAAIALDPAWLPSAGAASTLAALVPADGTYYVRVSALGWTDAGYKLRATLQAAGEAAYNDTALEAREENSRLVAGLTHTGALSSGADVDTWLVTTAKGSNFSIDFAGANASSKFQVTVKVWTVVNGADVFTTARAPGGSLLEGQVSGARSFSVDTTVYPAGATFVVSVASGGLATGTGTGNYTIKASGASLDLNDAPVVQVGGQASPAVPDGFLDLQDTVVHSYAADAANRVALSSLFTASDADAGQSLVYLAWLTRPDGSAVTGRIRLEPAGGASSAYADGTPLTAAQLATAYLYPGTELGDLSLRVQAQDSTAAPDHSGHSAYVAQTIRVVSADAGLSATLDAGPALVEGDGQSRTLTLGLSAAPQSDVTVNLVDAGGQFILSRTAVTFSAGQLAQQVTVQARDDGRLEGAHAGSIGFVVTSADPDYDQRALAPVTLSLADPANHAPTGAVTLPADAAQGTPLAVTTTALADADGLGTLNYLWQRSSDGDAWTTIAGASQALYTPVAADAGQFLRVAVSYVDGLGTRESVASAPTGPVVKTNDAPSTADAVLGIERGATHAFSAAEFPFTDPDAGDALGSIYLYSQPATGTLRFEGQAISVGQGFRIIAADIGKLTYTPAAGAALGDTASIDFAVSDRLEELSAAGTLTLQLVSLPVTADAGVALVEDAAATALGSGTFAFTAGQAGGTLQAVKITSLPASGTLLLDGVAVTSLSQVAAVSTEAIAQGKLAYRPAADANGDFTLGFQVSDGTALSAAKTLTLHVAAANDAPTGAVSVAGTATQGEALTASHTLADADGLGTVAYQWLADGAALPGATGATLVLSAAEVGKSISVRASYVDGGGTAESLASAATGPVEQAAGASLDGVVYQWKTHALLSGVDVTLGAGLQDRTGVDGAFGFAGVPVGPYGLQLAKALTSAETGSAISSADALAALRIAVGRNPNTDPDGAGPLAAPALSPYQLIAADVNGDGRVTSADALAILRMAVKRDGAPAREWLFVSEAQDFWSESANGGAGGSTLSARSVLWDGTPDVAAPGPAQQNVVAVLKGDVNGSWSAPAGSALLPDSHFLGLQAAGLGPVSQWGLLAV